MDKVPQEDIALPTESGIPSPSSPKHRRTDGAPANSRGQGGFDFLTFHKNFAAPLLTSPSRKNTAQDEKSRERPRGHAGSSEVCLIAAERLFHPDPGNHGQPSYLVDAADVALAHSHAHNSSRPDCRQSGKSLEDNPPGGCGAPSVNGEDGRQNGVCPMQEVAVTSSDEQVRRQFDYTYEDSPQSAASEGSNQEAKPGYNESISSKEEREDAEGHISHSDLGNSELFCSNQEEEPSGKLAQSGKGDGKKVESVHPERLSVGDVEPKVDDKHMSQRPTSFADKCADSCELAGNSEIERANDFCGPAGETMAKLGGEMADHETEAVMPARISQKPAEGDNDAGPFSVIEPVIWSETDREDEEERCNSEGTAGVELSPCETGMPPSSSSAVWPFEADQACDQFYHQSRTPQDSHAEHQAHCNATAETSDDGSCGRKSSPRSRPRRPARPLAPGDGRRESDGYRLGEQDRSRCSFVSFDHLKEVEHPQAGVARMDLAADTKEEEMTSFAEETETEERRNPENKIKLDNGHHKDAASKAATVDGVSDCADVSECGHRASPWLWDHLYGVDILMITEEEVTTVGEDNDVVTAPASDGCVADPRWTPGGGDEQGDELGCLSGHQLGGEDSAFGLPAASDAVVPGAHEFSRPQSAVVKPTALNRNDRFPPTPSAFMLHRRVPGGFDTFQKFRLPLDGDVADADNDEAALVSSTLAEKTPQRKLYHATPGPQSEEHSEEPANGDAVLAEDALRWQEQQPNRESAHDALHIRDSMDPTASAGSHRPNSDANRWPEFEMKKQFDMVLKELNLYFEISRSAGDSGESSPEQRRDIFEAPEASNCEGHLSSPELTHHGDTSPGAKEDRSLEMCRGRLAASCPAAYRPAAGRGGEQEVPNISHLRQDAEKHKEPREMAPERTAWTRSFVFQPFLEPPICSPPRQTGRLGPLRTCSRPIRVGLSRRAKTKQLHRLHPYE